MTKSEHTKEHPVPLDTEAETEPQPVLPRDVFSNKFTFFLYFLIRSSFFWFSLVLLSTCLFLPIIKLEADSTIWFIFSGTLYSAVSEASKHNISKDFELEQETRFLVEIRDMKPGIDNSKWDIVASQMNNYLFETKHYPHKYAFYDGLHCYDEFKKKYLLPYKDAFDAKPLNDSVQGEDGGLDYFKRQVSKDYYDSFD